jgi:hypothetical protein
MSKSNAAHLSVALEERVLMTWNQRPDVFILLDPEIQCNLSG